MTNPRTLALHLLQSDLCACPTPGTVRRIRELEAAMRGVVDDVDLHLACADIRAYLTPRSGESDRDVGVRVKGERRWHLVGRAAAKLVVVALTT